MALALWAGGFVFSLSAYWPEGTPWARTWPGLAPGFTRARGLLRTWSPELRRWLPGPGAESGARHSPVAALFKKGTPASVGTDTGVGTARLAPRARLPQRDIVFRPRLTASEPGSTLIWRQTSVRGPGPQRQVERKQVSAWLCPPFSVCAVPTLRPEGSRARRG